MEYVQTLKYNSLQSNTLNNFKGKLIYKSVFFHLSVAISYHARLNHSLDSKVISISGGDGGSCARSLLPPAVPCARADERTPAPNSNPRTNELYPQKTPPSVLQPHKVIQTVLCEYSVFTKSHQSRPPERLSLITKQFLQAVVELCNTNISLCA
ncbi:hypothetical protein B5X24_HaOG212788 [Helicoverpa armigera]|nr:hypothetical protein B5X24_HaOG212788 [Helicoverpa armigera]